MIKDNFEIELGNQLRSSKAPVPAGAWEAIQAGIKASPSAPSASAGSPISGSGFVVGMIAVTAMLISLSVYTNITPQKLAGHDEARKEIVENGKNILAKSPVTVVEQGKAQVNVAIVEVEEIKNAPASANHEPVIEAQTTSTTENAVAPTSVREEITAQPINTNGASQILDRNAESNDLRQIQINNRKSSANNANASAASIPAPQAGIMADKISGYAPLTVHFGNNGEGEKFYWEFGYMTESVDAKPEVIFEEPGTYTVFLTVENAAGDIAEDFVEITVKEGSKFYIQDAFTPNGDGKNDSYKIEGASNIDEFYMVITDENGNRVFETRDLNRGWEFDQSVHGRNGAKYFVSYRAIGIDGKVYSEDRKPIHILF